MDGDEAADTSKHDTKSIIIALVPKLPAVLSICCSAAIVRKVYCSPTKRKNIYHRIIFGLSCSDILASTIYFLGTWLIPAKKIGTWGLVFGASGNDGTCSLSGFFNQFAVCSPLYNGTLSWYYLLMIYYNVPESRIRPLEKWFHIIPVAFALISSVLGLAFQLYGNVEWVCWINPDVPADEKTAAQKKFQIFQWVFLFGPVWVCIFFVSVTMFLLWKMMRENEKKMKKYYTCNGPSRSIISVRHPDKLTNRTNTLSSHSHSGAEIPENDQGGGGHWASLKKSCVRNSFQRGSNQSASQGGTEGWKSLRMSGVQTTGRSPSLSTTPQTTEGWKNLRSSGISVKFDPKILEEEDDVEAQPEENVEDFLPPPQVLTPLQEGLHESGTTAGAPSVNAKCENDPDLSKGETNNVIAECKNDPDRSKGETDNVIAECENDPDLSEDETDNVITECKNDPDLSEDEDDEQKLTVDEEVAFQKAVPPQSKESNIEGKVFAMMSATSVVSRLSGSSGPSTKQENTGSIGEIPPIVERQVIQSKAEESIEEENNDDPKEKEMPKNESMNSRRGKALSSSVHRRSSLFSSKLNLSFLSRAPSITMPGGDNGSSIFGGRSSDRQKKLYVKASKSRQIAIQGMLYVCAFYLTWLFPTLQRVTELTSGKNFFVLQFFDTSLLPLQGFLNFFIYIRPRVITYRRSHKEIGFWKAVWTVITEIDRT